MDNNEPPIFNQPPPASLPPPLLPPLIGPAPRPTPASRKSRGWMAVALIALALLGVSLASNLNHVFRGLGGSSRSAHADGRNFEEKILEDSGSANKIAVLDVAGIITSASLEGNGQNMVTLIKDQLALAANDRAVKGVLLKVDSPGGEVLASDEIYRAISTFQKKSGKPVVATMGGVAASGGYYVSAPCQWIVASDMTITGSIGVIMSGYNFRGLMDKVGVRPEVYKSGKFKDMLSSSKSEDDILPEERQMVQKLIDETFAKFKGVVAAGRKQAAEKNQGNGQTLVSNWEEYADGRIISGNQAKELGFVDELGTFQTAVERIKTITKLSEVNLVQYQQPFDFTSLFRLFGKSEARSIKLDLGMDLPRLQVGRMYFMTPTFLN